MSSNIRVRRVCEYCGNEFEAKTTVTRFCSHRCNSRSHKLRIKGLKVAASNEETRAHVTQPMESLKAKEFLSIEETCKLIGISRMTLYRQIQNKKIKPRKIGRRVIIKRSEIDHLLF